MWCLWRSWLARQIVALEAESSNLSRHPTKDRTGAFLHGLFFYNGSSPSGKARDFDSRIREFEPRRPNHSSSCMNVQGELLFCRGDQWSPADACGNGKPSGRIWNPPLRRRGRCSSSTREGSGCRKAGGRPMAAPTVSPWPPLRGGSARRRWGRELYGCPKYFGLWQSSLPPPLRGTALAEGGQRVKKHRLCYIENVGATIGRPPAWRSNALSGMAFLQGIRARASNARPYRSFSTD